MDGNDDLTKSTEASITTQIASSHAGTADHGDSLAPVLRVQDVSKSYPGVRALSDVSLACFSGEVHALVGENGSGKSTLVKIISGALSPDQGSVWIEGTRLVRPSTLVTRQAGVITAYQDTSLVFGLTVWENVVLSFHGVRAVGVRVDKTVAEDLLASWDLGIDPRALIEDLTPAARQLLEVARALAGRHRVLLLDEPTANLDVDSAARLGRLVVAAATAGSAVLYISHRLNEVQEIAHRLTVLRDGVIAEASSAGKALTTDQIVTLMIGAPTDLAFPQKAAVRASGTPAMRVSSLRGRSFGPVDISVHTGEIVGIAGAEGNGQREILRAILGFRRSDGSIFVDGAEVRVKSPRDARAHGISFMSGDRAVESIFAELSVMDNSLATLREGLGPFGAIVPSRERETFTSAAEQLGIVAASPDQPIGQLSGGNQQKAVLARSVVKPTGVLIFDEPTQGVDAGARLDIYRSLRDQAASGVAILVNSSDAAELAGLCDRVYVVSRGQLVGQLAGEDLTEAGIVDSFVNVVRRESADETNTRERHGTGERLRDFGMGFLRRATAAAAAWWGPPLLIVLLMILVGGYAASRTGGFFSSSNMNSLFISALPVVAVALAQQTVLFTGGFDISVGMNMGLIVVIASFVVTGTTFVSIVPGILFCLGIGIAIGIVNGVMVYVVRVNAVIATIAMLGVLEGIAIVLRPEPGGTISPALISAMTAHLGFMPIAFIVLVVVAVLAELGTNLTNSGLSMRAAGMAEEPSRRIGVHVFRIRMAGYVGCAVVAAIAGLILASQFSTGANEVGGSYALPSFAACFIGGASLAGGQGSYVGAALAATFLSLVTNVVAILNYPYDVGEITIGVLSILAVATITLRSAARQALA